MTPATPAEHAATVREAFAKYQGEGDPPRWFDFSEGHAALDALLAENETLRADLEQMEANMALVDGVAQAAEAERDSVRKANEVLRDQYEVMAARVEERAAALRRIADEYPMWNAGKWASEALATDKEQT